MKKLKPLIILTSFIILLYNCKTAQNQLSDDSFILKKKKEGYNLSSYMSEKEASDNFQIERKDLLVFEVNFDCNSIADCDLLSANEAAIKAAQQIGIAINGIGSVDVDNSSTKTEAGSRNAQFTASIINTLVPNLKMHLKFIKDLKEGNKKYNIIYLYTVKKSEFRNAFNSNSKELNQIKQNSKKIEEIYDNVIKNLEKNQPL